MRKSAVIWLVVFCAFFVGCSKDAQIEQFLKEWNEVTMKMSVSLENGDANGARTIFDARKDSLKSRWNSVKDTLNSADVSSQTKQNLKKSEEQNLKTLRNAILKGSMKIADDKEAIAKMQSLMKDYAGIFTM